MTPKEKAEDLVNTYRMILMDEDTDCGNEILCTLIAKKNAAVCVDEILKVLSEMNTSDMKVRWQQVYCTGVIEEIERL